jgi:murein DD-endopeptidase MepM/ murein hydrolase activator NlpD
MVPFQMPFMYHQTWRASTYDGHAPDQDSIDLIRFNGSANISADEPVFASADGIVTDAFNTSNLTTPYGSVVTIDHGGGWKTQYVHLDDALTVTTDDTVVQGQRIGKVGQIAGLTPHLHYVQIKDGNAVRITFNGVAIKVYAGSKQPDGTYPTENLVSVNAPSGITEKTVNGVHSVTCTKGAGVRAVVECENLHTGVTFTKHGSWAGAKEVSTVSKYVPGSIVSDAGYEIS